MNINYKHPYQQKQETPILPFTPSSPVEGKAVEDIPLELIILPGCY